ILLNGTQLELSDTTGTETIVGPNKGVTVDAGKNSRVFQVNPNVTASISGLTITEGSTTGSGGGLYNDGGNVTLTGCPVTRNCTTGGSTSRGGGVYGLNGTTTLTDCTVSGNTATGSGGGVFGYGGTTTLTHCTVSGNSTSRSGGGLFAYQGTTTLTD